MFVVTMVQIHAIGNVLEIKVNGKGIVRGLLVDNLPPPPPLGIL